jgi:hypothetical protein
VALWSQKKESGRVIHLHRTQTHHGDALTLLTPNGSITIELRIRGLEIDASMVERLLHAPLVEIARDYGLSGGLGADTVERDTI